VDIGIATLAVSSREFHPNTDLYKGLEIIASTGFTHIEYND